METGSIEDVARKRFPVLKLAPLLLLAPFYLVFQELAVILTLVVADVLLGALLKKSGLAMLGLELTTVTAFLAGMFLGPVAGFVTGAGLYTLKAGIGGFAGIHLAWKVPGYGLFGALAYSYAGIPGAFGLLVAMRGVFYILTLAFDTKNAGNAFVYAVSSLGVNFIFFTRLLPVLA